MKESMSQANKLLTASEIFFFLCLLAERRRAREKRERGREGRKEVRPLFFFPIICLFMNCTAVERTHTETHIHMYRALYESGAVCVCACTHVCACVCSSPVKFPLKLLTSCAAQYRLGASSSASPKKQASATQMA